MEIDIGTCWFFLGLGGPSDPIISTGIYSSIFWHTESHLNWKNGTSYTLHQAILVQFGRNRDYETVCWETTLSDKLYNFRFTAIRSCKSNPADSLFCQPMRTFGQHILISVTTFIYIKNCVLISKPGQNWAQIPENPKSPARPLSFRTSKSRNPYVNKTSH